MLIIALRKYYRKTMRKYLRIANKTTKNANKSAKKCKNYLWLLTLIISEDTKDDTRQIPRLLEWMRRGATLPDDKICCDIPEHSTRRPLPGIGWMFWESFANTLCCRLKVGAPRSAGRSSAIEVYLAPEPVNFCAQMWRRFVDRGASSFFVTVQLCGLATQ